MQLLTKQTAVLFTAVLFTSSAYAKPILETNWNGDQAVVVADNNSTQITDLTVKTAQEDTNAQ